MSHNLLPMNHILHQLLPPIADCHKSELASNSLQSLSFNLQHKGNDVPVPDGVYPIAHRQFTRQPGDNDGSQSSVVRFTRPSPHVPITIGGGLQSGPAAATV